MCDILSSQKLGTGSQNDLSGGAAGGGVFGLQFSGLKLEQRKETPDCSF